MNCWLTRLVALMDKYKFIGKLGFHINLDNYQERPGYKTYSKAKCIKLFESKFMENTNCEIYEAPVDTAMAIYRRDLFNTYNGKYPEIPCVNHQAMCRHNYKVGRTTRSLSCIHTGYDEYKNFSDENLKYIKSKNKIIESKYYRRLIRTLKFRKLKETVRKFFT